MTHMIAQIHAYDVMGDVFIHAQVTDHDQSQASEDRTCTWTVAYPGVGEQYQPKWLRDVLQGLLEVL